MKRRTSIRTTEETMTRFKATAKAVGVTVEVAFDEALNRWSNVNASAAIAAIQGVESDARDGKVATDRSNRSSSKTI